MIVLSILIAAVALLLLWWGHRQRVRNGLPSGRLVALDLHEGQRPPPLFSKRYRLAGRPDYLIRIGKEWIPVEVKTTRNLPQQPYEAHTLQLLAYCLLVEETYKVRPRYGYLHYRSRLPRDNVGYTFRIEFNEQSKRKLLELLDQMRQAETCSNVSRSHQEAARCRVCSYAFLCDQKL
ncbi:MAG: Dna2/Cas4 domain-containing protein [Anaerolineales bacterium]|nr:Dna2/Cas4 domain-containing protein [Anaerolineales bacterium]MDW8160451.1 Dna2/Cas4 domain-containing protein [Anaerolineales bacterium]